MPVSSPRIDIRVVRFIRRFERRAPGIAAVHRATGNYCVRIGVTRPSYEKVRNVVHASRERRARRRAAVDLVLDVNMRARPFSDIQYLFEDPRDAPDRRHRRR
jgi:hypothetical protein